MLKFLFRRAAPWACAWLVWLPGAHATEEKPVPEATQSALAYPFDQYHAWRDEPVRDWRESNDHVGKIGGWRTYLRESQQSNDGAAQGHHEH
jgi:hypothetical protein